MFMFMNLMSLLDSKENKYVCSPFGLNPQRKAPFTLLIRCVARLIKLADRSIKGSEDQTLAYKTCSVDT